MANFQQNPCYTEKLVAALKYASEIHKYQIRKTGQTPYLSHLVQVMGLVLEEGGDENTAIGALLHDAVEDVEISPEKILEDFGYEIYSIVLSVTENKLLPKEKRKSAYIDEVRRTDVPHWKKVMLVSAADKLHNIRCYKQNWSLWKTDTAIFYEELLCIFEQHLDVVPPHWVKEMREIMAFLTAPHLPEGWLECPINLVEEADTMFGCENNKVSEDGKSYQFHGDYTMKKVKVLPDFDTGVLNFTEESTRVRRPAWIIAEDDQEPGQYICQIWSDYGSYWKPISNPTHDYCLYCGGSNGEAGEYRQGWDCHHCGAN